MSMISAQCDELRTMAAMLVVRGLPEVASVVREAANTILSLRDRAQALQAENAKLRELVEDMLDCIDIRMAFGRPLTSEMYEGFAQRAGELGIEVD